MPECQITQITNPTSSSSVENGSNMVVRWNHNVTALCNRWNINEIKLQTSYPGGSWTNVSTLYIASGDGVTDGSEGITVTIPSSIDVFGDHYRMRIEYLETEV